MTRLSLSQTGPADSFVQAVAESARRSWRTASRSMCRRPRPTPWLGSASKHSSRVPPICSVCSCKWSTAAQLTKFNSISPVPLCIVKLFIGEFV